MPESFLPLTTPLGLVGPNHASGLLIPSRRVVLSSARVWSLVVLLSLSAPAICICICICQPHLFSSQQLLDMDPAGCRIHPAHPITRRLTLSHRDYVIASSPNRLMQCLQRKHEMVGPPPNTSPRLFGSTAQMNQLVYCTPLLLLHHHDSQPRGPSRNQCF